MGGYWKHWNSGLLTRTEDGGQGYLNTSTNADILVLGVGGTAIGNGSVLEVEGDITPHTTNSFDLGSGSPLLNWRDLYLADDILYGNTPHISIDTRQLTGGAWTTTGNLGVGDTNPTGVEFYVAGDASVSGTLNIWGNVTVAGGTGKIDVGTVDPPYTINGEKYATYMSGMVGVKEEVTGILLTLNLSTVLAIAPLSI